MFFDAEKIVAMREMILSPDVEGTLAKLWLKCFLYQQADFKGIFKAMDGCRLMSVCFDPPLHGRFPMQKGQEEMAKAMGVTVQEINKRWKKSVWTQPMLGPPQLSFG